MSLEKLQEKYQVKAYDEEEEGNPVGIIFDSFGNGQFNQMVSQMKEYFKDGNAKNLALELYDLSAEPTDVAKMLAIYIDKT